MGVFILLDDPSGCLITNIKELLCGRATGFFFVETITKVLKLQKD